MGVSGVESSFNFEHQGELFNEEGKKEKNSHRADPSHPVYVFPLAGFWSSPLTIVEILQYSTGTNP